MNANCGTLSSICGGKARRPNRHQTAVKPYMPTPTPANSNHNGVQAATKKSRKQRTASHCQH